MSQDRFSGPLADLGPIGRDLMEALPGGVVYVNVDGSIGWANAEALRVLGLTHEALAQKKTIDFGGITLREDGSACPIEEYPVSLALQTQQPQRGKTIGVRRADGTVSWAIYSAIPICDTADNKLLGAIATFLDITERKRAEEELSRSRDLLRAAQRVANVGSWELDLVSGVIHWSDQMLAIHGIEEQSYTVHSLDAMHFVHPEDKERVRAITERTLKDKKPGSIEYRIVRPDGAVRAIWASGEVVCDDAGRPVKMIGAIQDVTSRRALEDQLLQSQRMESIGRLAGGVAHDFNNLLQVILGNADIALRDPKKRTPMIEIKMAAQRAADLTKQLLAFGRRQSFMPTDLDLNELLSELMPLLRRMLGERISVELARPASLPAINADRGQIEQVLINLCINARDAMPDGGRITVTTRLVMVDEAMRARRAWADTERYVVLEVADTGTGMQPEVRARAFEPFFTTKDAASGTGLGLAVVYGIVQQHRGAIELESEPVGGTRAAVFLPAIERPAQPVGRTREVVAPGGRETLLVVEDEVMVQKLVVDVLKSAGYRVHAAIDGRDALRLFEAHGADIALVVLDLVMPGISGAELGRLLHEKRANLPLLFTTGYAADPADIAQLGGERVLYKPYDLGALLREVRAQLDEKKA